MKNIFKPILFSTPMFQAILDGKKTQTRRIVKDEQLQNPDPDDDLELILLTVSHKIKEGDVLWVRETFTEWPDDSFQYYATTTIGEELGKWKPSIHMPKKACRIFLKVKSVRIERLNEISTDDAIAEGINSEPWALDNTITLYENYFNAGNPFYSFSTYGWNYGNSTHDAPVASFCTLWEEIHGEESWNANPFIWRIEFERIEKPLDFI